MNCQRKKARFLLKGLVLANLLLTASLFLQFNTYISDNFQIEQSKERAKTLSLNNEKLGDNLLELNHLKNLDSLAQKLEFEKSGKIHYLRVLSGSVVAK